MLWPWWALEVFSLGLSEIHALSESIPYISHSKMLPLDQPTRASQTTWLECVSDIQEERNQKGLIQFPCTIFFQKYIFTRARNQGTRFGLWIERSIFVIHLMPFAGKYYTLHLIQPQETLPVHSFIPCFAAENSQSGSEDQGSGEGFPRHRGSSAGLSTQPLRTACSFLTHTWLPASPTLDFRPQPHLTSGLNLTWLPASPSCAWFWSLLVVHSTQRGPGQDGPPGRQAAVDPSAHSTEHPCPPPGTFRFLIHFLPPISYPNQLLQTLLFI